MRLSILLLGLITIVLLPPSAVTVGAPRYTSYPIDFSGLKKYPEAKATFERLHAKFQTQPLLATEHIQRMETLKAVLEKEPDWYDGYWLYAADAYFLGSMVQDPEQHAAARSDLVKGLEVLDTCLKKQPQQVLCRFFAVSLQAKIASIDGIFASLKHGKVIRDTWLEVINSPYDLRFRPNVTLQGVSRFALGLFYRLVPDLFLMDWIWDIRGNIDTSIRYHREALDYDPKNPCAHLMLAVSLLCKVKGDPKTAEYTEAMSLLAQTESERPIDVAQEVCIIDAPKIRREPQRTCGYTQAKYQDEVKEDELKK